MITHQGPVLLLCQPLLAMSEPKIKEPRQPCSRTGGCCFSLIAITTTHPPLDSPLLILRVNLLEAVHGLNSLAAAAGSASGRRRHRKMGGDPPPLPAKEASISSHLEAKRGVHQLRTVLSSSLLSRGIFSSSTPGRALGRRHRARKQGKSSRRRGLAGIRRKKNARPHL